MPEEQATDSRKRFVHKTSLQMSKIKGLSFVSVEYSLVALSSLVVAWAASIPEHLWTAMALGDGLSTYAYTGERVGHSGLQPRLGYPFGVDNRFFPNTDLLATAFARIFSSITDNPYFGMNLVYLLSFPACACAVVWMLKAAGVDPILRAVVAVAFVAIPFHFYRLEHFFLATLWAVPIGLGVALRVAGGRFETLDFKWRKPKSILVLIPCLIVGSSGIYYSAFVAIVLVAAILFRVQRSAGGRDWIKNILPLLVLVAVVGVLLLPAQLAKKESAVLYQRSEIDSLVYSGRLVDALLPPVSSGIPFADRPAKAMSTIGSWADAVGAIGVGWTSNNGSVFLLLGVSVVVLGVFGGGARRGRSQRAEELTIEDKYSSVHYFSWLLVIVTGLFVIPYGLGGVFAVVVSPSIRAWDRMIPVFQLCILVAASVILQRGLRRYSPRLGIKWKYLLTLLVATLVAVLDTAAPAQEYVNDQVSLASSQIQDAQAITHNISLVAPDDCAILQLPFMEFPESAGRHNLAVYEPFWLALTGQDRAWSYGGVFGSKQDKWLRKVSASPEEYVPELRRMGFCAIGVDGLGYESGELESLTSKLSLRFGTPTAVGNRKNLSGTEKAPYLVFLVPGYRKFENR